MGTSDQQGLVDEYRLVVHPVVLGSGTPLFPALRHPLGLRLLESRTFSSGPVYLAYGAVPGRQQAEVRT